MTPQSWQRYMSESERTWQGGSLGAAICFYLQALGDVYEMTQVELTTMRVATCHRLADFWRTMDEPTYELRYLMRHPNPEIARQLQPQDKVQGCELIGRFHLT